MTDRAGNRFAGISDPTAWNFTTTDVDLSPPTVSIANDQASDTISVGDVVTYTLAFSEMMDATTIGATDFGNAGTAGISIGVITETSPGLFSVLVTPTSTGTLQLQVNAGAVITDVAVNPLDTASPIVDEDKVSGPAWLSVDPDGTLSGTPGFSDAGLNVFTVSVSDGIAEPVNETLNITVVSMSDEQLWKTSFGDADLSDLSADYDGDGLSNGEERIWGLEPTKGSSRNPIITPLNPATGKFRYTRRNPARTGKTFTVWTSGDLANWTQDTAATQLPGPMVDFIETVEVTLTALPVNGRLFVRVHASD